MAVSAGVKLDFRGVPDGTVVQPAQIEAELGPDLPPAPAPVRSAAPTSYSLGAHPVEVGLAGPSARAARAADEMGLPSGRAARHVANEVVLRDRSGHAVLRGDGTEALPAGGVQEGFPNTDAATLSLSDELAVRAIEEAPRDVITGQPGPAPLADDIVAEPEDTDVQRRVEDVTARAAGRHRARRT